MADTVSKTNNEDFNKQSKAHRDLAEHTRQMISQLQQHHDSLMQAVQSSCMRDAVQSYGDWWEAFRDQLLKYIDSQDKMADLLDKTVQGFDDTDTHAQQTVEAAPGRL